MKQHKISLIVLCVLGVLAVWAIAEEAHPTATDEHPQKVEAPSAGLSNKPTIRVATFDSRVLAFAYSRSYIFTDTYNT